LLTKIAKLEFKWVIRGSLLFSSLINIGHGWQFQAVDDNLISQVSSEDASDFFNLIDGYSYSDYPEASQEQAYFIFSIIYFLISFGVFFTLNTTIEVKIVRRMHKELKEKRERLSNMKNTSPSADTSSSTSQSLDEDKKRETEDGKKERRVIKMVVYNGIINFILRAPELLFWVENEGSWSVLTSHYAIDATWTPIGRYFPGILNFIPDIIYFTYILTFITNFFIFYKFNLKFKEAVVFWHINSKRKA
jgi:hypothetical protein